MQFEILNLLIPLTFFETVPVQVSFQAKFTEMRTSSMPKNIHVTVYLTQKGIPLEILSILALFEFLETVPIFNKGRTKWPL